MSGGTATNASAAPAYDAAVTIPTEVLCHLGGTNWEMRECTAGNATPSPRPDFDGRNERAGSDESGGLRRGSAREKG